MVRRIPVEPEVNEVDGFLKELEIFRERSNSVQRAEIPLEGRMSGLRAMRP